MTRVGTQVGDSFSVAQNLRAPLDAFAGRNFLRRAARDADLPEMAAIHVAAIGIEDHGLFVRSERPLLDFASAGSEQLRRGAAFRAQRVEMLPAILLAGDDQAIAVGPMQYSAASIGCHAGIRCVGLSPAVPDFVGSAGSARVRQPNRPGLRAIRLEEKSLRRVALLRGAAKKSDALAVGRPLRIGIPIDGRSDEAERLRA